MAHRRRPNLNAEYGRPNNDQAHVDYVTLKQHEKAVEIQKRFDSRTLLSKCTLAENNHFQALYPSIEYQLFFEANPITYNFYYTLLEGIIRAYALYSLNKDNKINIYAFNSSASLSSLSISATDEVLAPKVGTFIISFEHDNTTREIILDIESNLRSTDWDVFTKSSEDFSLFDKIMRDGVKKYNLYKNKVFTHDGSFLQLPNLTFDDIYLDDDIHQIIQTDVVNYVEGESVVLKKKNGLPLKRGVIFVGAPGTGKTFLSRVLANQLNTSFMVVTGIYEPAEITHVFNFAETFDKIIILFEDIDIYITDRDSGNSMLSTLLNRLDGIEPHDHIIVLCTTNKIEVMDKALNDRPGRFDRIIYFSSPSKKLKSAMLKGLCVGKDTSNINWDVIVASIPPKYTGAHLKEVYITACTIAIDTNCIFDDGVVNLTTDIFIEAIESIKNRKEPERIGFGGQNE